MRLFHNSGSADRMPRGGLGPIGSYRSCCPCAGMVTKVRVSVVSLDVVPANSDARRSPGDGRRWEVVMGMWKSILFVLTGLLVAGVLTAQKREAPRELTEYVRQA